MATKVDYAWITNRPDFSDQLAGYFKFTNHLKASSFQVQWLWRISAKMDWVVESVQSVALTDSMTVTGSNGKTYLRFNSYFSIPDGAKQFKFRVRPVSDTYTATVNGKTVTKNKLSGIAWYYTDLFTTDSSMYSPDPPNSFSAYRSTETGTNVRLDWTVSSALATGVEVWRSANGGKWGLLKTLVAKATGTYLDTSCVVGSRYQYKLRCKNGVGGTYSTYTTIETVVERPKPPKDFMATLASGGSSVKLTWTFQGNTGSGIVVDYATSKAALANNSTDVVHYTRDDDEVSNPSNLNTALIENLEPATYYFHLRRSNDAGISGYATTKKNAAGYETDWMTKCAISKKAQATVPNPGTPNALALYLTSNGYLRAVFQLPQSGIDAMSAAGEEEQWEIQFTTDQGTFQSDATSNVSVEDGLSEICSNADEWSYGTRSGWTSQGRGVVYDMTNPTANSQYRARARRVRGSVKGAWSSVIGPVTIPSTTVTAPAAPTFYALQDNGENLEIAFGNTGAKDNESTEIQISTLNTWATDAITTLTKDGGYAKLYVTSDGRYTMGSGGGNNTEVVSGLVYTWSGAEAGETYYVRLRRVASDGSTTSDWAVVNGTESTTTLSYTMPAEPGEVVADVVPTRPTDMHATLEDGTTDNVVLSWTCENDVAEAASYEIQWTDNAKAFADNAQGDIETASVDLASWDDPKATSKTFTVTDLTASTRYYFRVRKVNDVGVGPWAYAKANDDTVTSYQSETVCRYDVPTEADVLSAPTTIAAQTSYQKGEVALLAWTHNSEQESEQSAYQIRITAQDGQGDEVDLTEIGTITVDGTTYAGVEGTTDSAWSMSLTSDNISDGTIITWRVRTSGAVSGSWSPWSGARSFAVYAAPTTTVGLTDGNGNDLSDTNAECMPIVATVAASGSSSDNLPVQWWCEVIAAESYEDGESPVAANQRLWTGSLTSNEDGFSSSSCDFTITTADCRFVSGIQYVIRGGCVTAQGTRSGSETTMTIGWVGDEPYPSAGVWFDVDTLTCSIRPSCPIETQGDEGTQSTTETLDELPATIELPEAVTDESSVTVALSDSTVLEQGEAWHLDGHTVVVHYEAGDAPLEVTVTWPTVGTDTAGGSLRPDTTLTVYRLEADGTPVLLEDGIANDGQADITDPHPTFGTCTYRIIATDDATGMQGSNDIEVPTKNGSLVIQWDAEMVRLPYNVKVSESYDPDVSLREYAGRSHPVSYFGTQRGQSGSWSAEIIKGSDADRRALVRTLNGHMAPAYVREPTGLGYWAYVKANLTRTYGDASESVSITVKRVETPAGEVG